MILYLGIFNEESCIWLPYISSNPFLFWIDVAEEAPELSHLAKTVLSCAPHVASCERLWSSAAATITTSRNRVTQSNIGMILRVKHHFAKSNPSRGRVSELVKKIQHITAEQQECFDDCQPTAQEEVETSADLLQTVSAMFNGLPDDCFEMVQQESIDIIGHIDEDSPRQLVNLLRYAAGSQLD